MMRYRTIVMAVLALCVVTPVNAQNAQLNCNGVINGWRSTLVGQRRFQATNALGDGYVQFRGVVRSRYGEAPISWEGYSNLAPFQGVLRTPDGDYGVGVLDATGANGSQLIIYDGRASLGPPTVLGEFRCRWS